MALYGRRSAMPEVSEVEEAMNDIRDDWMT
jgi:hypothetical protein